MAYPYRRRLGPDATAETAIKQIKDLKAQYLYDVAFDIALECLDRRFLLDRMPRLIVSVVISAGAKTPEHKRLALNTWNNAVSGLPHRQWDEAAGYAIELAEYFLFCNELGNAKHALDMAKPLITTRPTWLHHDQVVQDFEGKMPRGRKSPNKPGKILQFRRKR